MTAPVLPSSGRSDRRIPLRVTQASGSTRAIGVVRSDELRTLRGTGDGDGNGVITYRAFLELLKRPDSKGFISAIRLFLFSIFGPDRDAPVVAWPRAREWVLERDEERVEVYGSSYLVER